MKPPRSVGHLMAAQAKAGVVVNTLEVRLPEIQNCIREGLTLWRQHDTGDKQTFALHAVFVKHGAERRTWFEIGAFIVRQRWMFAIAAGGCRRGIGGLRRAGG